MVISKSSNIDYRECKKYLEERLNKHVFDLTSEEILYFSFETKQIMERIMRARFDAYVFVNSCLRRLYEG